MIVAGIFTVNNAMASVVLPSIVNRHFLLVEARHAQRMTAQTTMVAQVTICPSIL